ncbi:hypothetical protein MD588_08760 [Photobacterium sp. SDRW27]|uniref:hypothetical protein n=1 Tax=Photobacterium obscurum TaxID=2829490 RepID=UPI002243329F|nr:hypothetical protein [Photobacterium obscurum]MCW8328898.1 hypothetical protein [Photobacterium obscurum]
MNKLFSGIMLAAAAFSGSVLACNKTGLTLDVFPQRGGAWVLVEKDGVPQAGVEVTVKGATNQRYTTTECGLAFVYSSLEASRSMTFEITDDTGNTVSTQRFIPSNRS